MQGSLTLWAGLHLTCSTVSQRGWPCRGAMRSSALLLVMAHSNVSALHKPAASTSLRACQAAVTGWRYQDAQHHPLI